MRIAQYLDHKLITLGPLRFAKHSHLPNSEVVTLQKIPQWKGARVAIRVRA